MRQGIAALVALVALAILRIGHHAEEARPIITAAARDAVTIAHDDDLARAAQMHDAAQEAPGNSE